MKRRSLVQRWLSWSSNSDAKCVPKPVVPTGAQVEAEVASVPMIVEVPGKQQVLLLHGTKQPYQETNDYLVPDFKSDREVLVRTHAIGLNPIDWKSPDFGFGIPELPFISGRESAGTVVKIPNGASRLKLGDKVIVISTDYRDLRKATYQEYVIAPDFNVARIPASLSVEQGATLGVAFIAASLALGICMGVDFSNAFDGPDLLALVKDVPESALPADIRDECLRSLVPQDRAQPGDWVTIWGGSSTSATMAVQLARLAGLRVVSVVDKAKHGLRLSDDPQLRPDLLVDSHEPVRAAQIIRAATNGKLRFALDTRGDKSAEALLQAFLGGQTSSTSGTTPPATPPPREANRAAHLVGLAGLPKVDLRPEEVIYHNVPIKVFHEVPSIGEKLVIWLERLLNEGAIVSPRILGVEQGLAGVNGGLDRMRRGEISGGKLVVRLP